MILSNVRCRPAVAVIIRMNLLKGRHYLLQSVKGEQAFTHGQHSSESGVLRDHGAASSQITGATITEPAALQSNVLVLGDREFSTRGLHIIAIRENVFRQSDRIHYTPAVRLQQIDRVAVRVRESKLQAFADTRGHGEKFQELMMFA